MSAWQGKTLLAWAAMQDRILLTHDVSTITAHAYRRVMKGDRMPGVFEGSQRVPVQRPWKDVLLWYGRVMGAHTLPERE